MNKKAVETQTLSVVIGLLIAFILSIILITLIWKFISPDDRGEEDVNYFYFTKVAKELNEIGIGDIKSLSYLTKKDFALIAFDGSTQLIKGSDLNKCINYDVKDVEKPLKCRDKNCLCLCESDLSFIESFYGANQILNMNCNSEEARCVELPLKVDSLNSCTVFILYDAQEKFYEIELKKERDAFKIKYAPAKTL